MWGSLIILVGKHSQTESVIGYHNVSRSSELVTPRLITVSIEVHLFECCITHTRSGSSVRPPGNYSSQ